LLAVPRRQGKKIPSSITKHITNCLITHLAEGDL